MKPSLDSIFSSQNVANQKPSLDSIFGGSASATPAAPAIPTKSPLDYIKEYAGNVGKDFSGAINDFMSEANKNSPTLNQPVQIAENALGATASGIKTVFAPITEGIKSIVDVASDNPTLQKITQNPGLGKVLDFFNDVGGKLTSWSQQHPEAARNLSNALTVGSTAIGGEAEPAINEAASGATDATLAGAKSAAGKVADVVTSIPSKVVETVKGTPEEIAQNNISQISDTISPNLNKAEIRNAISEGRVTRGKQGFVFGKRPDIVTQADEVTQAAKTINDQIPGANKLNDAQLVPALDTKIGEISTKLAGEMQKVPVNVSTVGKVRDAWSALKTAQEAEPEYDAFAGSAKSQAKFESYLKNLNFDITDASGKFKAPTQKTLNDIWQTRIDYDNSIPANVKNATPNSAPQLQWQKTMWLQNRALLNDAIHETASGLSTDSRQAFSDMSDMYLAKQNILSKAAIDTEGKSGIIPNNKKDLLKWGLGVGGGLVGADVVARKLGL